MRNDVQALREAKGMSRLDLGSAVGTSRQTIHSIETGKYTPLTPLAIKLARFLGKPVEEIFHVD